MKHWKLWALLGFGTAALVLGSKPKKKKVPVPPPTGEPDFEAIRNSLIDRVFDLRADTAAFLQKLEQGAPTGAGSTQALITGWATLCGDIDEAIAREEAFGEAEGTPLRGLRHLADMMSGELERVLRERDTGKAAKRFILTTYRTFIGRLKKANCEVAARLLDTWTEENARDHGPVLLEWVRSGLHPGPEIWQGVLVIERKCQQSPVYRSARQKFVREMGL